MRAVLALLALTGCAEQVNEVRLIIPDDAIGFSCVDSTTGNALFYRAPIIDDGLEASLVLDYLDFAGVPSCRPANLLRWCEGGGCPIVRRNCVRLRVSPVPAPEDVRALFDEEVRRKSPITRDAPNGIVVIRAVVTSQTCEELARSRPGGFPSFRCDALLGCVYSCPVRLDEVRGDVELELDALRGGCTEIDVGICAGLDEETACD